MSQMMSHNTLPEFWLPQPKKMPATVPVPFGINFQVSDCAWEVRKSRLVHVPEVGEGLIPAYRPRWFDAWEVRTDFLAVRNLDGMLEFLNRTGVFRVDHETFTIDELR